MKTYNFAAKRRLLGVKMIIKLFPAFDCYYLLLIKNILFCRSLLI